MQVTYSPNSPSLRLGKALTEHHPCPFHCAPHGHVSPPLRRSLWIPSFASLLDARPPCIIADLLAARTCQGGAAFRPRSLVRGRTGGAQAAQHQSQVRWHRTTNAASRPTRDRYHAANPQRGTRPMPSARARQTPTSRPPKFSSPGLNRLAF